MRPVGLVTAKARLIVRASCSAQHDSVMLNLGFNGRTDDA